MSRQPGSTPSNKKMHNIYQNTGELSELVRNAKEKKHQNVQKELMGLGLDSSNFESTKKPQRRNSLTKNFQTSDYYDPYGKKEDSKAGFDKYKTSVHESSDKKGSKIFEKQLVKTGTINLEAQPKPSVFNDQKKLVKTGTVNITEKEL